MHTWQLKEYSVNLPEWSIPSISHLSYHDRMRHLHLPSLQYCWQREDLIYLYQILRGNYDIDNHLFTPYTATTEGYTKKLFKHHTNSCTRSNFYTTRVINGWNSLPQSVVDSPSVNDFKTLLDRNHNDYLFDFV